MVCPFLCVVIIPSGLVGGVGVPFCSANRRLLSPGAKKGLPVVRKIPLWLSAILFYWCGLCGGSLRLFPSPGIPAL